jgi:hypothetical protein
MRRAGGLPYDYLADNTRWQRKPRTFDSVEDALRDTAAFYRKNLWTTADWYVEIWLEKDALSGVIYPVTSLYDVPLMVARGYASLSFLHSAAEYINSLTVPAHIYHFGDFDPSGVNAGRARAIPRNTKPENHKRHASQCCMGYWHQGLMGSRVNGRSGPRKQAAMSSRCIGRPGNHRPLARRT